MKRFLILSIITVIISSCVKDKFNKSIDTSKWSPEIAIPLMEGVIKVKPDLTVNNTKPLLTSIITGDTIKDLSDIKKLAENTSSLTFHIITKNRTPFNLSSKIILKGDSNLELSFLDKNTFETAKADTTNNIATINEMYATIYPEYISRLGELEYAIIQTTIDFTGVDPTFRPKEGQNNIEIIVGATIKLKIN